VSSERTRPVSTELPRQTLRDKQKRDTRRFLIEAADRVFHRRGFQDATIEDITNEAGASRPTFYLHFRSKAEIAAELFTEIDPEVRSFNERLDALDPPTRAEIRRWLGEVMDWFVENRVRVEAYEQALAAEQEIAHRWFGYTQQGIDAMPRYLGRWQGKQRELARLRMLALIMQVERLCYFTIVRDCPVDRDDLLDVLTEDWWRVLGPGTD
jgi:AcrR family transcriptional regulator